MSYVEYPHEEALRLDGLDLGILECLIRIANAVPKLQTKMVIEQRYSYDQASKIHQIADQIEALCA